jgi:hypothetical protein
MVSFHEDAQVARLLAYVTGMVNQRYSRQTNQSDTYTAPGLQCSEARTDRQQSSNK